MDPISAGLAVVGFGMQAYGAFSGANTAKQAAQVKQNIAAEEQKLNQQRRLQMELSARREQLQIYRNNQRLRAQATQAAVNQGASMGSGLQGGLAGVTAGSAFNLQGVTQNLEIGRNMFAINDRISGFKQQLASLEGDAAEAAGWASLGGSLMKNSGTIGQLSQNAFAGFGNSGGNYQGMPWSRNTGGLY